MTNENKPRIVIAQKNYEDIEGIRRRIGEDSQFMIDYTHDPREALELVAKPGARVLVSGLSFHGGDLFAFGIAEKAGWGEEYLREALVNMGI